MLHSHHPVRIFFISGLITLGSLVAVGYFLGPVAMLLALVLILVEITFSFENAIINAKVLSTVSEFWQRIFMTVGIFIAVFGMRLVFPIVIVMAGAGLPAGQVIELALDRPDEYAAALERAHPSIAAFGGMFLLMLCLHFFFDPSRKIRWIDIIERPLQRLGRWWIYVLTCLVILLCLSSLPFNEHPRETLIAGLLGIVIYLGIHGLAELFTRHQENDSAGNAIKKTGLAGFTAFMYLEVLDASFSFDGVIGAFAVTQNVIIIAIGLGVGALWVRSLTLFMVRRSVLKAYRYLEHGAHYTIGLLAVVLLIGLFFDIPEALAGLAGIVIVSTAIVQSIAKNRLEQRDTTH
ncbi:MAG TPA: DUF475 domain-containing protein [Candidatus Saccharimonadales bacterium]|jgi:hypothetical protein